MNLLYGIIKPRYEEILEIIRDNVFDDIHTRVGIKSVVLTGGGSKIYGLKTLCENILNRKTRIGQIENSSSFFYWTIFEFNRKTKNWRILKPNICVKKMRLKRFKPF